MVVVDGCWLLLALTSAYYFLTTLYKRVAPQEARQLPRGGGICRYGACWRGPKNPGWRPTPGSSPVAGGSVVMAFAGRRPKDSPHVSEAVAPEAWGHGTPHRNPLSPYRPAAPLARVAPSPFSFVTWRHVASGSARAVAALAAVQKDDRRKGRGSRAKEDGVEMDPEGGTGARAEEPGNKGWREWDAGAEDTGECNREFYAYTSTDVPRKFSSLLSVHAPWNSAVATAKPQSSILCMAIHKSSGVGAGVFCAA